LSSSHSLHAGRFFGARRPHTTMFDDNAPQYRCCCGACHSRTGALIIAILMVVGSIASLIQAIAGGHSVVYSILAVALSLAMSVLLLIGILREIPVLMIPAMVIMVIEIVMYVVLGIMFVVWALVNLDGMVDTLGGKLNDSDVAAVRGGFIAVGVVFLLCVLLQIWFFTVILACYRYLRDHLIAATSLPTTTYVAQANQVNAAYPPPYGQQAYGQQPGYAAYPTTATVYPAQPNYASPVQPPVQPDYKQSLS